LFGAPAVDVLIGEEAHASVFSALQALGFGHDRPVRVAVDDQGAMKPDALATALERCTGPTIVVAQAGQLNSGAFDPLTALAPIARARGAWIHVDGAFGLWARACPSRAHLADGVEFADLLGDRRAQVAADALRLRLRDRARPRSAPSRDDHRRQLPAIGRRGRTRPDASGARAVAPGPAALRPGRCCAISAAPASPRWSSATAAAPA
jgi:hypothetical protein